MSSSLTLIAPNGNTVAAQILVGIDGRTIYDAKGVPLVGPASYSPEQAAYSAIQDANTYMYTTLDVLLEFNRGAQRDLQRTYNGLR